MSFLGHLNLSVRFLLRMLLGLCLQTDPQCTLRTSSLRVAVQPISFRFRPCFHMTLPQSPSYGEGDSRVYRAQHSVYYFWLLFLLVVPRIRCPECSKDIAVPGTTSSPAVHQDSRFLEWAVSISLPRLLMQGKDMGPQSPVL